ncbi:MAG: hypothetical protein NTY95_09515, partial [Bacteroidia bacterium]|nr:hypothetical protein [Bacteroidia bacterium]
LESLKELNADIVDLDWQVDIEHSREILGHEVVLGGNINPVLIQDKSEEEVYALSRRLVDKYKDQKYLLAAGCEITVLTSHQNLMAMRKASLI